VLIKEEKEDKGLDVTKPKKRDHHWAEKIKGGSWKTKLRILPGKTVGKEVKGSVLCGGGIRKLKALDWKKKLFPYRKRDSNVVPDPTGTEKAFPNLLIELKKAGKRRLPWFRGWVALPQKDKHMGGRRVPAVLHKNGGTVVVDA